MATQSLTNCPVCNEMFADSSGKHELEDCLRILEFQRSHRLDMIRDEIRRGDPLAGRRHIQGYLADCRRRLVAARAARAARDVVDPDGLEPSTAAL